jgi:hypothetical protein
MGGSGRYQASGRGGVGVVRAGESLRGLGRMLRLVVLDGPATNNKMSVPIDNRKDGETDGHTSILVLSPYVHTSPSKHPKLTLPHPHILVLRQTGRLCLQRMPRCSALHRVVREVCDGADGFAKEDGAEFARKEVQEKMLNGGAGGEAVER